MAEAQEIMRVRGGQYREIGLRVLAAMSGCRAAEVAVTNGLAEFGWSHGRAGF
jgi:hypothetical protein